MSMDFVTGEPSRPHGHVIRDGNEFMTTAEVAEFLGFAVITIRKWRTEGVGPPFTKIVGGRGIRYRRADVEDFMKQGRRTSTYGREVAA